MARNKGPPGGTRQWWPAMRSGGEFQEALVGGRVIWCKPRPVPHLPATSLPRARVELRNCLPIRREALDMTRMPNRVISNSFACAIDAYMSSLRPPFSWALRDVKNAVCDISFPTLRVLGSLWPPPASTLAFCGVARHHAAPG